MAQYRTIIEPEPSKNKISYNTPVLFMGSCFAENIGDRMEKLKFPTIVNPFGVLYNPSSVRSGLEILLDNRDFNENDLHFFNDQWLSFYHDTEFSNENKEKCLDKINKSVNFARKQLQTANYLIITFGTAWTYQYIKTGNIVSNCHKIPANEFERRKLTVEDIFVQWAKLLNRVEDLNPDLKIIFTVSPVRHWKDGAVQNQLSKSTLILAINQLIKIFDNVEYFPAYEIMMDDLRDYRFYADDMLHPSGVAIDYIWDQFSKTYFGKETSEIIKEVSQIIQAKNHRPLNPDTKSHKKFIQNQVAKINKLSERYSYLNFKSELDYFYNNL
ncbi:MAG: GSCFA domain-containing protein [Bacteroidales bacterium]|nr:GSCFA domain-containing protein [Bacteroidales bacterium]